MRAIKLPLLFGIAALGIAPLYAQGPPPIHGLTGTIATQATIRDEHKAAHKIIVVTADGVEHAYDAARSVMRHGGKDPLAGLKPGTTVLIHYSAEPAARKSGHVGRGELSTTEGTVTKIDRGKKQITIRYDDGRIEALTLTDRAAADVGANIGPDARIVVYSSDEAGGKVAYYFKTSKS